jgi:rRNA maturation endonuclease Nob1
MATVRRCLGCSATYPPDQPACPKCGSHAGEVEQEQKAAEPKPKPARQRKA